MSRCTGDPIPENKGGNWVYKEQCSSVSGWKIQEGVRTQRVMVKDKYFSW